MPPASFSPEPEGAKHGRRARRVRSPPEPSNPNRRQHGKAKHRFVDVAQRARKLGVPLAQYEVEAVVDAADRQGIGNGKVLRKDWKRMVKRQLRASAEKQAVVEYAFSINERSKGQALLNKAALVGVGLFAITGTQVAGEAGMHIVGSVTVGCVTALGGGTLNNVLMGNLNGGVEWVRDPRYVILAMGASIATFYGWPLLELHVATRRLQELTAAGLTREDKTMSKEQVGAALQGDPRLEAGAHAEAEAQARASGALPPTTIEKDTDLLFDRFRVDDAGRISGLDLQLSRINMEHSKQLYILESLALGAFCVVGAQQGIHLGVHPVISAVAGVTILFGGVCRDLFCQRGVALGVSSYCLASFVGSSTYVAMRGLHVYLSESGWRTIPLGARILVGASSAIWMRWLAWQVRPDELLMPMGEAALANHLLLQDLGASFYGTLPAAPARWP